MCINTYMFTHNLCNKFPRNPYPQSYIPNYDHSLVQTMGYSKDLGLPTHFDGLAASNRLEGTRLGFNNQSQLVMAVSSRSLVILIYW